MNALLLILIALILDLYLGEPKKHHPLIWFGNLAKLLETRFNTSQKSYRAGVFALLLAVLPVAALFFYIEQYLQAYSWLWHWWQTEAKEEKW